MILEALHKVVEGQGLSRDEARTAMQRVLAGEVQESQTAALLIALRMKGETLEELTGFADAMRNSAVPVEPQRSGLVDTCGTGGDGGNTFNISTAAAFVAAGMGIPVAKHGNRAVSSKCGSADVLSALGIEIELTPEQMARCIDDCGFGFLYAPALHPAMKHAAAPRRALKMRTVFNMLGPLCNPAGAEFQLVGSFSEQAAKLMAGALKELGSRHAMVVHSSDGLDEISIFAPTQVFEIKNGELNSYEITPEELGIESQDREGLAGGDADYNAAKIRSVLEGEQSSAREIVAVNAGAAAMLAGKAASIREGAELAREAIDSGAALNCLDELAKLTQGFKAEAGA